MIWDKIIESFFFLNTGLVAGGGFFYVLFCFEVQILAVTLLLLKGKNLENTSESPFFF